MKTEHLEYLSIGKLLDIIDEMRQIMVREKNLTVEQTLKQPACFLHNESVELILRNAGTAIHENYGCALTLNLSTHPRAMINMLTHAGDNSTEDKSKIN